MRNFSRCCKVLTSKDFKIISEIKIMMQIQVNKIKLLILFCSATILIFVLKIIKERKEIQIIDFFKSEETELISEVYYNI